MKATRDIHSKHNFIFWFHLAITLLAFIGPFLFSWYWIVPVYLLVLLQFRVYNRCLLNSKHDMDDTNATFYSYLFHQIGIQHNVERVKRFVRGPLYALLAVLTILIQLVYGFKPLLF